MKRWILVMMLVAGVGGLTAPSGCAGKHKEAKEGKEVKVKFEDCPKAVQDTLTKESGGGKIEDIVMEQEKGKTVYEAAVEMNGQDWELKVAADGTLIKKKMENEKDKDKDEMK